MLHHLQSYWRQLPKPTHPMSDQPETHASPNHRVGAHETFSTMTMAGHTCRLNTNFTLSPVECLNKLAHNCLTKGFNCGKKLATQLSLPAILRTSSCPTIPPGRSIKSLKAVRISKFFLDGNRTSTLLALASTTRCVPIFRTKRPFLVSKLQPQRRPPQ